MDLNNNIVYFALLNFSLLQKCPWIDFFWHIIIISLGLISRDYISGSKDMHILKYFEMHCLSVSREVNPPPSKIIFPNSSYFFPNLYQFIRLKIMPICHFN